MKRIVVHIDRLVLGGIRTEDRHAVAAGLQEELGKVFGDPGAVGPLSAMGSVAHLRVARVPIEAGGSPQQIGQRVAAGIGREINK